MLIQSHLSPDLFGMYYPKFGSTTIYKVKNMYIYIYILYMLCIFTWVSLKCNEEV